MATKVMNVTNFKWKAFGTKNWAADKNATGAAAANLTLDGTKNTGTVPVSATLNVSANQLVGTYNGKFSATVIYQ
jgi:hypothetical protein